MSARPRIVFLDKDGTLVENVPYNVDPARVQLRRGSADGLRRLHQAGYLLVVVTNQSGVARGFFAESALAGIGDRLRELLADLGVLLAGFSYCPHHPAAAVSRYRVRCVCRKPHPGLLVQAAHESGADLTKCWMVGDILDDVEAGRRAGCRTILLNTGGETEWRRGRLRIPHHVTDDLDTAARVIVAHDWRERLKLSAAGLET